MRELFEIFPKILLFNFLVIIWSKSVKLSFLMCQGQTEKISCLSPGKIDTFPNLALLFHLSLPKIWHSYPFINFFFEKYTNRAVTTQSFILTLDIVVSRKHLKIHKHFYSY